jgi:hypothetical protein
MKLPPTRQHDGVFPPPLSDLQRIALLRQLVAETKATIAQSRALINLSRGAMALLARLEGSQILN